MKFVGSIVISDDVFWMLEVRRLADRLACDSVLNRIPRADSPAVLREVFGPDMIVETNLREDTDGPGTILYIDLQSARGRNLHQTPPSVGYCMLPCSGPEENPSTSFGKENTRT